MNHLVNTPRKSSRSANTIPRPTKVVNVSDLFPVFVPNTQASVQYPQYRVQPEHCSERKAAESVVPLALNGRTLLIKANTPCCKEVTEVIPATDQNERDILDYLLEGMDSFNSTPSNLKQLSTNCIYPTCTLSSTEKETYATRIKHNLSPDTLYTTMHSNASSTFTPADMAFSTKCMSTYHN